MNRNSLIFMVIVGICAATVTVVAVTSGRPWVEVEGILSYVASAVFLAVVAIFLLEA